MRTMKYKKCEKCEREISTSNYDRHIKVCKGKIEPKIKLTPKIQKVNKINVSKDWIQNNGLYKCPHCDKEYTKDGIGAHIWHKHTEKDPNYNLDPFKDKRGWSKGLTAKNDDRVKKGSETKKRKYESGELVGSMKGKNFTEETKKHLSEVRLNNFQNGTLKPAKGVGRGKGGWYKGYWCDSSYELAFVIYNLEHNIYFERNTEGFEYEFENKKHSYFPDYIMEDGNYVEIKGYETEQTKAKHKNFPHKLTILKLNDIKYIINYVQNKYGKDYIKLYEDNILKLKQPKILSKEKQQLQEQKQINKKIKEEIKITKIEKLKEELLNSNIDFSKFGWVGEAAKILNMSPSKVNCWMKRNMLDFYHSCFVRKNNI